MPYNSNFDLRGKRIQDTYQQVLEIDTGSSQTYNGLGTTVTVAFATSASYARTSNASVSGTPTEIVTVDPTGTNLTVSPATADGGGNVAVSTLSIGTVPPYTASIDINGNAVVTSLNVGGNVGGLAGIDQYGNVSASYLYVSNPPSLALFTVDGNANVIDIGLQPLSSQAGFSVYKSGTPYTVITLDSTIQSQTSVTAPKAYHPSISGSNLGAPANMLGTASWAASASNAANAKNATNAQTASNANDIFVGGVGSTTTYYPLVINYPFGGYQAVSTSSAFTLFTSVGGSVASTLNVTNISSSLYGTSSWAVNVVNGGTGGTTLYTASTYQITASWAVYAISSSYTSSVIVIGNTTSSISSSWASSSFFASFVVA